jgi:hypothetical protein
MSPGGANNGGGFFRSRANLIRRPRRLSDGEEAVLASALAPILRDIRAAGAILPVIVPAAHEDRGDDYVCAWITFGARDGTGIWVPVAGSAADQVFWLAEQMVEWECEKLADAGRSPAWPPCPDHPGKHPLRPEVKGELAVWQCPKSERLVSEIGALPAGDG